MEKFRAAATAALAQQMGPTVEEARKRMDKLMPLSSATAVIGETAGPLNPKSAVPARPGALKMQHQPSIVAPSSTASASGPKPVASPAKSDQRPVQKNVNPVIVRNVSFIEKNEAGPGRNQIKQNL